MPRSPAHSAARRDISIPAESLKGARYPKSASVPAPPPSLVSGRKMMTNCPCQREHLTMKCQNCMTYHQMSRSTITDEYGMGHISEQCRTKCYWCNHYKTPNCGNMWECTKRPVEGIGKGDPKAKRIAVSPTHQNANIRMVGLADPMQDNGWDQPISEPVSRPQMPMVLQIYLSLHDRYWYATSKVVTRYHLHC